MRGGACGLARQRAAEIVGERWGCEGQGFTVAQTLQGQVRQASSASRCASTCDAGDGTGRCFLVVSAVYANVRVCIVASLAFLRYSFAIDGRARAWLATTGT